MNNEIKIPSLEQIAEIEAAARYERSVATRAMIAAVTAWVASKFSSKTTTATA